MWRGEGGSMRSKSERVGGERLSGGVSLQERERQGKREKLSPKTNGGPRSRVHTQTNTHTHTYTHTLVQFCWSVPSGKRCLLILNKNTNIFTYSLLAYMRVAHTHTQSLSSLFHTSTVACGKNRFAVILFGLKGAKIAFSPWPKLPI